jgi:competence protein ComEC
VLNKEIPFIRIGFPICLGIIAGLYYKPGIFSLAISSIIIILGFSISLFYNKGLINHLFGFPMSYAFFLCGLLLYMNEKKQLSDLEPVTCEYLCSLSEYPEEKGNSYRTIVRLYAKLTDREPIPLEGSMMIYFRKDSMITSLLPGDLMQIRCIPKPVVNRGNPYEFDYRFYMENRGIKYFCMAGADDVIFHSPPSHRKLRHRALIVREKIINMYKERGIKDDRLALVAAITLGQKNMLDPEKKQIFIKAGVMHIMAVSGLHAVIISMFLFHLLFFMKGKFNTLRILITVLLLWSFAFVTGLTPSVLRATLMFSFLQAGKLMKRNVNSINSVLASAVILIIFHPSVLFDAGFLLSYSAVIFIICFYHDFYLKMSFRTWTGDKIWQSAAVTILAQAGTLPLTIALFNRFPTWFIITNIIIVPLSSFLIIIGCLVPLTYPVKFISQPLATLLDYLTGLTETLTEKAASLPLSTIENIGMVTIESVFLFSFIFLFMLFILNRKTFPIRYPLYALLLFLSAGTARSISDRTSGELIVYNGIGSSQIGIRTGRVLNLLSDTDTIFSEVVKHCVSRGLKVNLIKSNSHDYTLEAGNKSILVCNNLTNNVLQKVKPDMIILRGKFPRIDKKIDFIEPVEAFIMTSDVVSGYRFKPDLNRVHPDTIHYVRSTGAFRRRL